MSDYCQRYLPNCLSESRHYNYRMVGRKARLLNTEIKKYNKISRQISVSWPSVITYFKY